MTSEFLIRPFVSEDGSALAALHRRSILDVSARFYSQAERESWAYGMDAGAYVRIAAENQVFRVAIGPEGGVLGFSSHELEGCTGKIAGLYTDRDAQGRGVGQALLVAAEQDLVAEGARRLRTEASLSAVAFYERHGYQAVARMRRPTRGGLEIGIWHMEKLP